MNSLEKVTKEEYVPIVHSNSQVQFISYNYRSNASFNTNALISVLPTTIIDKETLLLIQLEDLHKAADYNETATGSATLFRSLMQPITSLDLVHGKQESLRELESNDKLRQALDDYVGEFAQMESALFKFLNNRIDKYSIYEDFPAAKKAAAYITSAAKSIPNPKSQYLNILTRDIETFTGTSIDQMMNGNIYRTFKGLKPSEEVSLFTPAWRFMPTNFNIGIIGGFAPFVGLMFAESQGLITKEVYSSGFGLGVITLPMVGMLYDVMVVPAKDSKTVIDPLRERCIKDRSFMFAVEAIGKIDELLSFYKLGKATSHPTVLPNITDNDVHHFKASNLINPVQGKENPNYVPNDVNLNGSKLSLITGPNSGGKTTYCKSIVQNQILGQIGCYVFAGEASMNIADKIYYQAPSFDALQDEEGRFGTELKRTKEFFYNSSPKSLVILDELAEGTTIEEKIRHSHRILDGFHTIGNNTLLITHNHELVEEFKKNNKGQYLQVEFNGDVPTHKIIDGISYISHADRVAQKIGFSEEDILNHLKEKGYIKK